MCNAGFVVISMDTGSLSYSRASLKTDLRFAALKFAGGIDSVLVNEMPKSFASQSHPQILRRRNVGLFSGYSRALHLLTQFFQRSLERGCVLAGNGAIL